MVKHIVIFEIKKDKNKDEVIKNLKSMLDGLPSKIREIKDYEIGINYADSPLAKDMVLISTFDTKEDLENYRVHPEHKKVVEYIKETVEASYVVDYEV